MAISLIYTDFFSGGELYQCGAADIPGTPSNFTYRWQEPDVAESIGNALRKTGVRLLVLAAREYQLGIRNDFTQVVRVPMANTLEFTPARLEEIETLVFPLAHQAAELVSTGNRVLVSCWEGDNRASLITSLILRFLTGCQLDHAVDFLTEKTKNMEVFENAALRKIAAKPLPITEKE